MLADYTTTTTEFSNDEYREILGEIGNQYAPLAFTSYAELGIWALPELATHKKDLYDWQKEISTFICEQPFSIEDPCKFLLLAANGSGKDAYCIALFAVWFACCKIRSRCIITSGSFKQLNTQTEPGIVRLCECINKNMGGEFFRIRKQHIICTLTGSEIYMFVTDEANKAEGYHPFDDSPGRDCAIVLNEAKGIPTGNFRGLNRCTYNYWIEVSSAGSTGGDFYKHYRDAIEMRQPRQAWKYSFRKVTIDECPHISREKAEADQGYYGAGDAILRSQFWSEFTSQEETTVISRALIDDLILHPPAHKREGEGILRAGIDFSLSIGGDECGGYIIDGNMVVDVEFFRNKDANYVVNRLAAFLDKWRAKGLVPDNVNGDEGGLGRALITMLADRGWPIRRLRNESKAANPARFRNRGIELYYNVKLHLQHRTLIIPKHDETLKDQLSNRYFNKPSDAGVMSLESKIDAKLRGHGSPDRADAYVLAYANVKPDAFVGTAEVVDTHVSTQERDTQEAWSRYLKSSQSTHKQEQLCYLNLGTLINSRSNSSTRNRWKQLKN